MLLVSLSFVGLGKAYTALEMLQPFLQSQPSLATMLRAPKHVASDARVRLASGFM
jgi:hypothetical protein